MCLWVDNVFVISLVVKDEFGVTQRILAEFTRNKINIDSIVGGTCEQPGKSRIVISMIDENDALTAATRLQTLQDVYEMEMIPPERQAAYALMAMSSGGVGVVGRSAEVNEIIERSKPERYVKALNAL